MTDKNSSASATDAPKGRDAVLNYLREAGKGTLIERMGIELIEASAEKLVGTMPVDGNTQPYGLLHGGASVVLAETLGSFGAAVHAGPGRSAVGIEVSATHHRSARDGLVTATATALHLGRRTAAYEIIVRDAELKRLATARLTCMILENTSE